LAQPIDKACVGVRLEGFLAIGVRHDIRGGMPGWVLLNDLLIDDLEQGLAWHASEF
jgi:hypothetical protein